MKKRQILFYVVIMFILLTSSVYATLSTEFDYSTAYANNALCPGGEFTVTVSLKNLQTDEGVKAIEGYLDIDDTVLNVLTKDSIVTNEDGKVRVNDDNILSVFDASNISSNSETGIIINTNPISGKGNYKFVINFNKPVKQDTDLFTLKFNIKDNATIGEHENVLKYKLFKVFSDNADKIEIAEKVYKLTINEKPTVNNIVNIVPNIVNNVVNNNTVNNNTSNNVTNNSVVKNNVMVNNIVDNKIKNNTVSNAVVSGSTNTQENNVNKIQATQQEVQSGKTDGTSSKGNLPKTGYTLIIVPIIAVSVLGIIFYKKYSKYNFFD